MAKKFLLRILPDQAKLEQSRVLRGLGPWVLHPAVWTLHRRSVAGGVAAGLFFGLFPAPFQMFGAAISAFIFHWNLPVAVLMTLYTNPLTFIPLYVLALQLGIWLLNALIPAGVGHDPSARSFPPPPDFDFTQPIDSMMRLGEWILGMGWPLVAGVFTLASSLAIIGYVTTRVAWNLWVRWEVVQRRKRHALKG